MELLSPQPVWCCEQCPLRMGQRSGTQLWVMPPPSLGRIPYGQTEPGLHKSKARPSVYQVWIQLILVFKGILFFTSKTVIWPLMQHRVKCKNSFLLKSQKVKKTFWSCKSLIFPYLLSWICSNFLAKFSVFSNVWFFSGLFQCNLHLGHLSSSSEFPVKPSAAGSSCSHSCPGAVRGLEVAPQHTQCGLCWGVPKMPLVP